MKRIIILFFLLSFFRTSFCQVNLRGNEDRNFVFSLGLDEPFINNTAFNAWTESNYNRKFGNSAGVGADVNYVIKSYDFGIGGSDANSYVIVSIYAGKRLTSLKSSISSFLNFQFGQLSAYPNFAPINYVPTVDQQGKQLHLMYTANYIGLSSKNYLNKLKFNIGKTNGVLSCNTAVYVNFGYAPWGGNWQYGYNKDSGKGDFVGAPVYSVPNLSHMFFNAGILIGIGN